MRREERDLSATIAVPNGLISSRICKTICRLPRVLAFFSPSALLPFSCSLARNPSYLRASSLSKSDGGRPSRGEERSRERDGEIQARAKSRHVRSDALPSFGLG